MAKATKAVESGVRPKAPGPDVWAAQPDRVAELAGRVAVLEKRMERLVAYLRGQHLVNPPEM